MSQGDQPPASSYDFGGDDEPFEETFSDKFARKFQADPFVPIGCALTAGILGTGLFTFSRGQGMARQSQMAMRARVAMQGLTVAFLMAGTVAYNSQKEGVKRRMTQREDDMIRHFQAKAAAREREQAQAAATGKSL